MRGQSQLISVVIVITLALFVIALVLPWAFLMIQKKKDMKSLDDVYNFFQTLDTTIRNIAKTGGEESLQLKVPGELAFYPESLNSILNNSIVFSFGSKVSNIAECDDCWIPLNTPNMNDTGTLGLDSPSVIMGRAEIHEDNIDVNYRLWYRTLNDTSGNAYKIVLNTSDNMGKTTTTGFLRIQKLSSKDVDQTLTITEINIIV